ncbi:MAG: hypothetical protein N2652_04720 [Kiritimatiellae bacterium]|nr:hypothetical protein [Kiritimatiellia bacterium]
MKRRPARGGVAVLIAGATLCGAASAIGRVYWLRGESAHGATTAGQPGWNRAHTARIRINEGRADLEVLGVTLPATEAERLLVDAYRTMGADVWAMHGEVIGWGIAVDSRRVVRWLIVPLGHPRECLVVRLTQSREEFLASARPPTGNPIPSLPPAPALDTVLFVADETAHLAAQLGRSALPAPVAAARLADDLVQAGWHPVIPPEPDVPPLLFRRGQELCAVITSPQEGGSSVLRLHKLLGGGERP